LAGYYLQTQQTNSAAELLQRTISRPDVPTAVLRGAAEVFARIDDFPNLKTTLRKLAVADPTPEAWYDLARVEIHLGEDDEAIKDLGIAIHLSDRRLQNNPQALDIRAIVRTQVEFDAVRNRADFQNLVSP
jgi:thioredoxin-like negative regulator of GroEL